MAIEGQFKVDGRDSDLLTLYDDAVWLRLLVDGWLGHLFLV
jgi:hypothetical protein